MRMLGFMVKSVKLERWSVFAHHLNTLGLGGGTMQKANQIMGIVMIGFLTVISGCSHSGPTATSLFNW